MMGRHFLIQAGHHVKIEVHSDDETVAREGAAIIAADARAAVSLRGRFIMAVSGGRTPWLMLRALAGEQLPWENVHVFQVDERVAPEGDPDRNLTHLRESLLARAPQLPGRIYAMPVEAADLNRAAQQYAATLQNVASSPSVLDLVHLGLGPDGHTASLVPGDPVLDVINADVTVTRPYQGRRRMTLTFPIINRARRVLWLVTGRGKVEALVRLRDRDPSIPASRVRQDRALILADRPAAQQLGTSEDLETRK
jgi:6-phosphogluconolactonase